MSTIHKAGFDVNGFAGTWDRHGRYIPRVGETFTVAEWRRYKHPGANGGQPDGSWKGEPFRCIEVKRAFDCSCCGLVSVVGQALPNYDFQIGSPFLSRIEFNTDIVRLEPSAPKFSEFKSVEQCLREEIADLRRTNERLRSEAGHLNARLVQRDLMIRVLQEQKRNALCALNY
jgi:hypothetical protein